MVLAGCGGDSETTSGESPITATVHRYEAAFQDHDAAAVCDLLAPPVPKNCEAAFERELRGTKTPDLKVRSVKVDGSTARVNIDSPDVAYLDLVRVDGRWYVQLARELSHLGTTADACLHEAMPRSTAESGGAECRVGPSIVQNRLT